MSFCVSVLGRVDEKCAQHEQSRMCEDSVETDVTNTDKPQADLAQPLHVDDIVIQELQQVEVNTEASAKTTEDKLPG